MKKLIFISMMLFSITAMAQFNVQSGTKTEKTITVEDKSYDIYSTSNNSEYIICTSPKTNNEYAVWIGTETDKVYDSKPVRKTKSGKYFILIESKNSKNPYPKYIKEEDFM